MLTHDVQPSLTQLQPSDNSAILTIPVRLEITMNSSSNAEMAEPFPNTVLLKRNFGSPTYQFTRAFCFYASHLPADLQMIYTNNNPAVQALQPTDYEHSLQYPFTRDMNHRIHHRLTAYTVIHDYMDQVSNVANIENSICPRFASYPLKMLRLASGLASRHGWR